MEDARLLELLRCDRERGMAALMEQYAPLVRAVVRGKLAPFCPEEVEPCTADTFADFLAQADSFHERLLKSLRRAFAWLKNDVTAVISSAAIRACRVGIGDIVRDDVHSQAFGSQARSRRVNSQKKSHNDCLLFSFELLALSDNDFP